MKLKQTKTLMRSWLLLFLLMFFPATLLAQNVKKVSGTVFDENGEALIGATITELASAKGVITDFDGNFSLDVTSGAKSIQVSYVGYKTKTVNIPVAGKLTIRMEPDETMLQETVVIGYGVQRKSDLTGSVSNVSSKDFNQGVINSPEQLINGKVSGVQIVNGGGSPSAGSTIRIRGGASLNASNDPLIVLDGVPMEVGGSVSGSGNFLSLINPNDIESMTILKDASSTAIYGSR
jgi:iron complex outermembrane receptor protein